MCCYCVLAMMGGPSEVKMKLTVSSLEKSETLIVGVALVS